MKCLNLKVYTIDIDKYLCMFERMILNLVSHVDNFIKLPNSIYDDLSITNEELTVLVLLYRNYVQYKNIGVSSIQLLADYMMVDTSNNRRIITIIRDSIISLVDKKYIIKLYDVGFEEISINNPIRNKYFPFQYELIPALDDGFFTVSDMGIIHIFKQLKGVNVSKFNIIRYYVACCRVSNNTSNFGYLTQGKLKQLVTDSRSIQKYNKILQDELHLIRYDNNYLTQDKHYCTTFIGKWDDEANFNKQLEVEVGVKGLMHTDKVNSNKKRSIQQKINNIDMSEEEIRNARIAELQKLLDEKEELEYKPKDNIIEEKPEKPKGLQNNKQKPLPLPIIQKDEEQEEPDIFEDWFNTDNNNEEEYIRTEADIQAMHEIDELNRAMIPDDVLRIIEQQENEEEDDDFEDD